MSCSRFPSRRPLVERLEDRVTPSTSLFQVDDLVSAPASSQPAHFVNVNGTLFFAADDGVHGTELWKSDGTEAGTALVKDILPGPADGTPRGAWKADVTGISVALGGRAVIGDEGRERCRG